MHGSLLLVIILLALGLLLSAFTITAMAIGILRPPRMTDGRAIARVHRLSPGDLALDFVNENFVVRDARTGRPLTITGWWIPAPASTPSDRCAILLHGYADAKVGAIAWAPLLHKLGLHVLAIDLRAHGESDGRDSTGGFLERDDVDQVIDQLLARRPTETRRLVLFGVSLGAAVAAATAARRDDLAALILESPFADYRRIVTANTAALGLPTGRIIGAAISLAERLSGADFNAVRPVDTIPRSRCPLLMILGSEDELLDAADVAALERAVQQRAGGPSLVITADNATHLMAIHVDPAGYASRIGGFLEQAFATNATSA